MQPEQVAIAVIGGTGLYNMEALTDKQFVRIDTPFGAPSSEIVIGTLGGRRVAFLSRHGIGHVYAPSEVPYRANIYALKLLGVRFVISISACGSLQEAFAPGHFVIPDQLFDFTRSRPRTFFDSGIVAHVDVAEPFCRELNDQLYLALHNAGGTVHRGGTFITIEGPRFSTRGESEIYRAWGCSIIGMTTSPEAFLAREAEMAYGVIAHVTDYDVWHASETPVTTEMVIAQLQHNVKVVEKAVLLAVEGIDQAAEYGVHNALSNAIATAPAAMTGQSTDKLKAIVGRYLGAP